ncbi:DUF6778 family protein [Alisedimentitalea sp. MJ-SS2]|uniref:DUF6778 family protein n=1 Tax=Aliisedimentitalea sp. MJ-SS2 TaxID=3049795 RepID=UPI0029135862|nr:DUF6778 family protein [Alisedimentitalea sp. MJ-SS2]MDU8926474.1 DUF6778 family protein [Alisedimentitalea sp. MJ-SS2]
MKYVRMVALIGMGLAVSGCATVDTASRNAPFEAPSAAAITPSMKVESYQIRVPNSLKVSEANLYYPSGDIVWRGEPLGNRHSQVQKIFEDSLARGAAGSNGKVPVLVDIEVTRFHALTEKARYTVGGRHEIHFTMNFLNPETRQPVAEPRKVDATFKAFGGARAVAAEQNGVTQKSRISNHLAGLFQKELGIGAAARNTAPPQPIAMQDTAVTRNATPLLSGNNTSSLY